MRTYCRAIYMTSKKNDIFVSVRQKLLDEGQSQFPKVPQDLKSDFEKQGGWAGAMSGATAGAALGTLAGLSMPELGLVAAVPVAVVLGIVGYFGGAKAGSKVKKD